MSLRSQTETETDAWCRIETFIRLGISIDDEQRREAWLLWMQFWRAALSDDQLMAESAEVARGWRTLVRQAVDDGVAARDFVIAGTPEEAAASLVALVDGLSLQVLVGDRRMRSARATSAAIGSARRILGMAEP